MRKAKPLLVLTLVLFLTSGCSLLSVETPPIAVAHVSPSTGKAPLAARLDASASSDPDGTIASCTWSIDQTDELRGMTATYTFTTSGTHWIELTVIDDDGLASAQSVRVDVENVAPKVSCQLSTDGAAPEEWVTFDASGSLDTDGTIVDVTWAFGDGSSQRGSIVRHAYVREGTYLVTLTVEDNCGARATLTHTIVVFTPSPSGGCSGGGGVCL